MKVAETHRLTAYAAATWMIIRVTGKAKGPDDCFIFVAQGLNS